MTRIAATGIVITGVFLFLALIAASWLATLWVGLVALDYLGMLPI